MILSVSDEGYYSNVSDEGYYNNVPAEGYYSNVSDEGYYSNVSDEGYYSNVSDEGYYSKYLMKVIQDTRRALYIWYLRFLLQSSTQKTKDGATQTPLKPRGEFRCPGGMGSSCSTSDTHHVNLVTNSVI